MRWDVRIATAVILCSVHFDRSLTYNHYYKCSSMLFCDVCLHIRYRIVCFSFSVSSLQAQLEGTLSGEIICCSGGGHGPDVVVDADR